MFDEDKWCANKFGEKNKMTREEASLKVFVEYADPNNSKQGVAFVKSLEALGLLKFEEEKELSDDAAIRIYDDLSKLHYVQLGHLRKALHVHGYKIVLDKK